MDESSASPRSPLHSASHQPEEIQWFAIMKLQSWKYDPLRYFSSPVPSVTRGLRPRHLHRTSHEDITLAVSPVGALHTPKYDCTVGIFTFSYESSQLLDELAILTKFEIWRFSEYEQRMDSFARIRSTDSFGFCGKIVEHSCKNDESLFVIATKV